ncbi:MAG: ABC transporter permease, partial [Chloroflexi bacterium]|nr:ABC transporter permease [Chloroflexota bacterium]
QFTILAPPADTPFIDPDIIEGRWLQPDDTNALVIASELATEYPELEVGREIRVDLGPVTRTMEIVGIVNLVGIEFGYAPFDYITRVQGAAGQSFVSIVGMERSTLQFQTETTRAIEERYKDNGIGVGGTQTTQQLIGLIQNQVNVVVGFMLFMAVLLAIVGGLGLASTMSLNVLERTREIGVMRAIGASDGGVRNVFLTEGLLIGFISWILAAAISVPISSQFAAAIGNAFFERPLDYVFEPLSVGSWFIIVMLIAAAASLVPSNRAAQVSVRESLAYE